MFQAQIDQGYHYIKDNILTNPSQPSECWKRERYDPLYSRLSQNCFFTYWKLVKKGQEYNHYDIEQEVDVQILINTGETIRELLTANEEQFLNYVDNRFKLHINCNNLDTNLNYFSNLLNPESLEYNEEINSCIDDLKYKHEEEIDLLPNIVIYFNRGIDNVLTFIDFLTNEENHFPFENNIDTIPRYNKRIYKNLFIASGDGDSKKCVDVSYNTLENLLQNGIFPNITNIQALMSIKTTDIEDEEQKNNLENAQSIVNFRNLFDENFALLKKYSSRFNKYSGGYKKKKYSHKNRKLKKRSKKRSKKSKNKKSKNK